MKKLNKAMSVAVAAAMMVSLGACGNSADAAKDGTQSAGASGKVYNIGICQQLEHPALDQATQGFEDVLKEKLGDNVKFDLQNAQNEQANASTIANNFVSSNVDLILANATTALQACAAATTDIPILGTSVTDYATALEIDDWSGTTGRNISGTSDLAPLDQQEDMLVELYPDAKHVAILYCSAEANSKYQATEFEKYLDEDGISSKSLLLPIPMISVLWYRVQPSMQMSFTFRQTIPWHRTQKQSTISHFRQELRLLPERKGSVKDAEWQRFPSVIMTSEKRPVKWHMTF